MYGHEKAIETYGERCATMNKQWKHKEKDERLRKKWKHKEKCTTMKKQWRHKENVYDHEKAKKQWRQKEKVKAQEKAMKTQEKNVRPWKSNENERKKMYDPE